MPDRDLTALHQTALDQFKLVAQLEEAQRARELEDLKFADPIEPSDQWSKGALDSRAGLPKKGDFPPVAERPALTINKLRQPIQQIVNAQRQARLSLVFAPEGEGTSLEDASVFEDIARAIQADSRAHLARNWAFDRAVKCGRGYYRIETDYVNDRSRDQKIIYQRILNQFSVYYDPFCQEPDFSDAQWCFVTEDIPWPRYKVQFKDSALADYDDEQLTATGDQLKGWVTDTEQGKMIRVAEYFFFDQDDDTLVHVPIADTGEVKGYYRSELQANKIDEALLLRDEQGAIIERSVTRRKLRWGKMNGVEFLKEVGQDKIIERDGKYIPIVPVIADEANINGHRRYTGIVRPCMDAQRLFNVEASTLAEAVHLAPLAPFVGYTNQFEGFEGWWAQLNTRRFPYLPVNKPQDAIEATLPLPQRNTAEQPIQAIAISLKEAEHYIDITTGIPPAALGQLDPHERSGKAILALQNQSQLSTSGYVDNLANMSMLLEGKILRDLIPKIYDRPGRTVAAMGDDDSRRTVMLNAPFTQGTKEPPKYAPDNPDAKHIDLAAAEVAVSPTVGKSHTTKREEGADAMGNLAQAVPELVPAFADLWVKNMDFPGARQISDRLARAVPPQFRDEQDQASSMAKLQQQLAQMQQQMQEMAPLADKNKADLMKAQMQEQADSQREAAKLQSEQQRAALESQRDLQIEEMKNATAIRIAEINAAVKGYQTEAQHAAQHEQQALNLSAEESARSAEAHEAEQQRAHEQQQAARQHAYTLEQGDRSAAHASQQAQEEAALNPPQAEA